jgi:hypothetical protein
MAVRRARPVHLAAIQAQVISIHTLREELADIPAVAKFATAAHEGGGQIRRIRNCRCLLEE